MSYTWQQLEAMQRANPDLQLVPDAGSNTTPAPRQAAVWTGKQRITLDYPPSSNRYWRIGKARNGRTRIYRSDAAKDYIQHVADICTTAGIKPLDGDVTVTLRVYRPRRSGDLDNRIKILGDAMQGHFYHNDSQIVAIHATRHDDPQCPRVEVEITEL